MQCEVDGHSFGSVMIEHCSRFLFNSPASVKLPLDKVNNHCGYTELLTSGAVYGRSVSNYKSMVDLSTLPLGVTVVTVVACRGITRQTRHRG